MMDLFLSNEPVRIALWGSGRVARAFLERLERAPGRAFSEVGASPFVCGLSDRRAAIRISSPAALAAALEIKQKTGLLAAVGGDSFPSDDIPSWLEASSPDILIDCSVSDFDSGLPGLLLYQECFKRGIHVLTANKAPLVHGLDELLSMAAGSHAEFRYGATVGASLPVLSFLETISLESPLHSLEIVLNGTTNWILTAMEEQGSSLREAVEMAKARGYAEPDPRRDVEGADTAAKLLILGISFLDRRLRWEDLQVEGIGRIQGTDLSAARNRHCTIKLVGTACPGSQGSWRLRVAPEDLAVDHPLAGLKGTHKGVRARTEAGGDYALLGGASGPVPTALSMIRELKEMLRGGRTGVRG